MNIFPSARGEAEKRKLRRSGVEVREGKGEEEIRALIEGASHTFMCTPITRDRSILRWSLTGQDRGPRRAEAAGAKTMLSEAPLGEMRSCGGKDGGH